MRMPNELSRTSFALFLVALLLPAVAFAGAGAMRGVPIALTRGVSHTTAELMALPDQVDPRVSMARLNRPELEGPERDDLPQASGARAIAAWPMRLPDASRSQSTAPGDVILSPQTVSTAFNGATLTDTGSFPPDGMGAVGPTQYVVFVNGRLRTFNKTTGIADGVLNANPDGFFGSVMTPVGGSVVLNFTTDPQVRYDRLTGRWFLTIIDVPCTDASCTTTAANRLLVAVSDAASNGVISASTVWTFYYFQAHATNFLDYPSLGIDANALYIGGNMFTAAGSFAGCNGYVVRKSSVLSGGPIVVTTFASIAGSSSEGPYSPRGVDNFDPAATEGYFVGVSVLTYGTLVVRRVSTPGGTPTISANILLTVSTTSNPIPVAHLGNTGGNNGRLDAIDDRLFAATLRGGRLWTAHNIAVTSAGVASSSDANRRNGVRWYELTGLNTTPTVVESGTLYDNAATLAAARQYFIPSMMVSGQGHVAMGYSTAGTNFRADAGTVGRLSGATLGTLGTPVLVTASSTAYNPASDPGGTGGRRWGDYSFVSLDPLDDMTMWSLQQYCEATNSYAVRIAKLLAPPPATPTSIPSVENTHASVVVSLTGTSASGSGFYDPGADLAAPARPFNHVSVSVTNTGVTGTPPTVNSVTYVDPTHLTVDLNTTSASANLPGEAYSIVVTNPDGQSVTGASLLTVTQYGLAVPPGGRDGFVLEAPRPNPTTGSTTIAFTLPKDAKVDLSVLDVEGRVIATLASGVHSAGRHELTWNGRRGGALAPAGMYFVRMRSSGNEFVRRLAVTH